MALILFLVLINTENILPGEAVNAPISEVFNAPLDGALGNLVIPAMAGWLGLDDLQGPFQHKLFYED